MRCRSLAIAIKRLGEACIMVGPPLHYKEPDDDSIFDDWICKTQWHSEQDDANALVKIALERNASALVVDDYRIHDEYQAVLVSFGTPWLQFDYKADRTLWADIVVNANPAALGFDYKSQCRNSMTTFLLGPRYALLRPEFTSVNLRQRDRPVRRMLVTFGGGDDRGAVLFVLPIALSCSNDDVEIIIVSGLNNPRNGDIQKWVAQNGTGRVRLLVNPPQIAQVFASCDIAIMSAGATTFEAAACGLPMLLVSIAENQERQAAAWEALKAAKYLGKFSCLDTEELARSLRVLIDQPSTRRMMSDAGTTVVDGTGATTVASALLKKFIKQ